MYPLYIFEGRASQGMHVASLIAERPYLEWILQVFFSITFMGMGAGMTAALAPDLAKAKPAMLSIFGLIDTVHHCQYGFHFHIYNLGTEFSLGFIVLSGPTY